MNTIDSQIYGQGKYGSYILKPICRGVSFNMLQNSGAYQYNTLKKIQNTVRVSSTLYMSDLAALNVYQSPLPRIKVNWNQMSDRRDPHIQTGSGYSQGSFYHGSSVRHTQTRMRPGAGTPGGVGVDIKHNSYHRYLNRLKGGKLARPGVIPPTFGLNPTVFNRTNPIYGGKVTKTSIVSGCGPCICPEESKDIVVCDKSKQLELMYRYPFIKQISIITDSGFSMGQKVYARPTNDVLYEEANIIEILGDGLYNVQTINTGDTYTNLSFGEIIPYFPCDDCYTEDNLVLKLTEELQFTDCILVDKLSGTYVDILNILKPLFPNFNFNPYYYKNVVSKPV
jgi:hypothetical protein